MPGLGTVGMKVSMEKSLGGSYSSSNSKTDEQNWNKNSQNSKSNSDSVSETLGSSETVESNIGNSHSKSNSHSSSSSNENRIMDSISFANEKAIENSKSTSLQNSLSESSGSTYAVNEEFQSSQGTSISNNLNEENKEETTVNIEKSNQTTFTVSVSANQGFSVKPGECKILVCYPFVISAAIPYNCIEESGEIERIHSEIILIDSSTILKGNLSCAQSLINCEDKDKGNIFLNNKMELNKALKNVESRAHFDFGKEFVSDKDKDIVIMISENSLFRLVFLSNGELIIKRHQNIVWRSEMKFFSNYSTKIRINEKGHLIQESKDLFTNTYPEYRKNQWITVWSSAPINHNVTIGIPFDNGISYVLILSDTGVLNMYDSVGALIWCTDKDCQHKFGYKFHEKYILPILSNSSNFSTPFEPNSHNSISKLVKEQKNAEFIFSDCRGLKENKAILSANQRFKLILEDSGNLVIKDGIRTMWESESARLNYAVGPYKLLIGPTGNLIIRSNNGYMVWMSTSLATDDYFIIMNSLKLRVPNYTLRLFDDGHLAVVDLFDGIHVWESWPLGNINTAITYYQPIEYRYIPCHGKPFINIKQLISINNSNTLFDDMNIISKNGIWDLVILNQRRLVIRKLNVIKYGLFLTFFEFDRFVFGDDGFLRLLDNKSQSVWLHKYLDITQEVKEQMPLTIELSNIGELIVKDKNKLILWNYNEELIRKHELISNQVNTLKLKQYLVAKNYLGGLRYKIMFFRNKLQLFSKHVFIADFFSKSDCFNNTNTKPKELKLLDGRISLVDTKDIIICEIKFENKNDGPFKLILNDATVEIYNRHNIKVMQKKLDS